MPGGETLEQVSERAWAAVEPIVERHRGETVLLVAHHTINKTIICRTLGMPLEHFRALRQPPCAISVIDFSDMGTFVRAVNLNWREDTRSWIDLGNEVRERLMRVEGVAFDFDGVLFNSMPFYAAAWRGALVERGIAPPEIELYRRESERGVNSARHFLEEAGREASGEAIAEVIDRVRELYKSYPDIEPYPGVFGLVERLREAGRKLALVTGSPRADIDRFLVAEQQGLFETIVTCDDVKHSKPDPEPYALARDRLGLPAERVLAIENSPYGIVSARGAGLLTAGLTTTLPAADLAGADFIVDSLDRLPAWLDIH
jgi:HAD superfamily hydrolase (TIGR01509 family)